MCVHHPAGRAAAKAGWALMQRNHGAAALCHHEAVDGSGYPKGLSGDDIPLGEEIWGPQSREGYTPDL